MQELHSTLRWAESSRPCSGAPHRQQHDDVSLTGSVSDQKVSKLGDSVYFLGLHEKLPRVAVVSMQSEHPLNKREVSRAYPRRVSDPRSPRTQGGLPLPA